MRVYEEMSIRDFKAWAGAIETQEKIIENNLCEEFDHFIEESYPEGITKTKLNDILWFYCDKFFSYFGIDQEDEENNEEED